MIGFLYKGMKNEKTIVYLFAFIQLYIIANVSGFSMFLINPNLYYCTNIDSAVHQNLVLHYAGQPTYNQNDICLNFKITEFEDNRHELYLSNNYEKGFHFGVGLLARTFNIPANWLLSAINLFLFWCCFLFIYETVKLVSSYRTALLSIFVMLIWPEPMARMITNGWVTQNLINFIILFALYVSVLIFYMAKKKFEKMDIGTLIFYFIFYIIPMSMILWGGVILSHQIGPLLKFWINPIDQYRTYISLLFVLLPLFTISLSKFIKGVLKKW